MSCKDKETDDSRNQEPKCKASVPKHADNAVIWRIIFVIVHRITSVLAKAKCKVC